MQDKIDILKQAAEEKTKAYEDIHYNLIRANNNLRGHRRHITANGLEQEALRATAAIKRLEGRLMDAEVGLERQNNGLNQANVRGIKARLEKERKRQQEAGSNARLIEARKKEKELEAEIERLQEEGRHAETEKKHAAALLKSVTEWLDTAGEVEPVQVTIPKDATLESVRDDIEGLQAELVEVDTARLDNDSLKKQARSQVAQAAEQGRPDLTGIESELAIESSGDAFAMLAYFYPDQLVKKLEAQIDALPGKGLSEKERKTKHAELEAKILNYEYVEEALILRDGGDRRADAHPMAVLGVKLKEEARAA